jgi:putative SOS response-associated peptidase YedK
MPADFTPRFNAAPSQNIAVVSDPASREARWMRWGLIPSWAKDPDIGNKMINARSETLEEKPSFRSAFAKRRCLVIADGFYEWHKPPKPARSQPYLFRRSGGEPFAFAGLWEFWRSPQGLEITSCTIITCDSNACVAPVHPRMPVMLSGDAMWEWLEPDRPLPALSALLKPYPADQMVRHPVSTLVNKPDLDHPELVAPLAA